VEQRYMKKLIALYFPPFFTETDHGFGSSFLIYEETNVETMVSVNKKMVECKK
jgi:hypothetical protein